MTPKRYWPRMTKEAGVTFNIMPRLPGSHALSVRYISIIGYKQGREIARYSCSTPEEIDDAKQTMRETHGPSVVYVTIPMLWRYSVLELQFSQVRKAHYDRIDNSIRQDEKDPDLA